MIVLLIGPVIIVIALGMIASLAVKGSIPGPMDTAFRFRLAVRVGGGGLWALRGRAPKVDGLRVLDAHEYRTLQSLVEVMLPKN